MFSAKTPRWLNKYYMNCVSFIDSRSYAHELYYTSYGIDQLALQWDFGLPLLRASCSYSNSRSGI